MDLTSSAYIKKLFNDKGILASKGLGQNFLIDRNVLEKIIKTAEINPDDVILEIGPGIGTLTQELAKSAKKVIAVEKDAKMTDILKKTMKDYENVEIVLADILKLDPKRYTLNAKPYKVVANLPYYITSPVIRKFLESENPPSEMILMVQKEVARRICASPVRSSAKRSEGGQNRMNLLAVSVQFYAEPKIVSYVSKNSFWPSPKVDSAIIKITVNKKQLTENKEQFFKIVKAGFSQPRKQLINNLSNCLKIEKNIIKEWLLKNNIQPSQRAESIPIIDWVKLAEDYSHLTNC